ncbi:hypothetical protein DEO72_LG5g1301 [Vigna unguiculata]|uniref:Uncharacterized protein n=1 Tax=Vigna unguiculata TaxID=3917 RepID=A0A4D6LVZ7_VIGUN|nr:hypothetical protein DEO72_LG5g1301 [Vigna unguiculata]
MQICVDDVVAGGRLFGEASCERGRVLRQRCSTPGAVVGCVSFDSRRCSGGFVLLLQGMVAWREMEQQREMDEEMEATKTHGRRRQLVDDSVGTGGGRGQHDVRAERIGEEDE